MNNNKSYNFCNNCGKGGHVFHMCKHPITSIGMILFRMYENKIQFLMIKRKHSLGFVEFMRGKYPVYNYEYLLNIFNEMSNYERDLIKTATFDELWTYLWGEQFGIQYRGEERISRDKFTSVKLLGSKVALFLKKAFCNTKTVSNGYFVIGVSYRPNSL